MKRFTQLWTGLVVERTPVPYVCFTLQVRADRLADYRERHAAVWPEMLRALRDAGWAGYRLFLREDGLLVGIVETDDLAAAQAAMDLTAVNGRWQAAMTSFFDLPDGRPDRGMHLLDEIFDLDAQLAAIGEQTSAPNGDRL